jgi:hypothetical protein
MSEQSQKDESSAADPHHFHPDPTFQFHAEPDPTFQFDTDPTFKFDADRIRPFILMRTRILLISFRKSATTGIKTVSTREPALRLHGAI